MQGLRRFSGRISTDFRARRRISFAFPRKMRYDKMRRRGSPNQAPQGEAMGKLFYIIGRSASGKDRLQKELQRRFGDALRPVVMYTTRPMRSGEQEGEAYHFITPETFAVWQQAGRVIESRTYQTVHGPWTYATLDDGQIDLSRHAYLMVGTPESYCGTRDYFGADAVMPLFIHVEEGQLLQRALLREMAQEQPKYAELCRRFLADAEDFSAEKLEALKLPRVFENDDFDRCADELEAAMREALQ